MDILNFDKLVSDYYTNLHTTLRNFRPEPEYLESWVHDEDVARSLLGIFESASDAGLKSLGLQLGLESLAQLDEAALRDAVQNLGTVSVERHESGALVSLEFQKPVQVHPAYRTGLEIRARELKFCRALEPRSEDGEFILRENLREAEISIRVTSQGLVTEAAHNGYGLTGALCDVLCECLVNRPIQEGGEHAAIRAEQALRSRAVAPPVPGLVTPQNADPLFADSERALRALSQNYFKTIGSEPGWNDWEDPLSPQWKETPTSERVELLQKTLETIIEQRGLPYRRLQVVSLKNDVRVILNANLYRSVPRLGPDLMVLEKELQRRLEPRLELTLESLDDQNRRETRTDRDTMTTVTSAPA